MMIKIANRSLMCSTLILGCMPYGLSDFEEFKKRLRRAIKEVDDDEVSTRDIVYDHWSEDKKSSIKALDNHSVSDYAFMTCTCQHRGEGDEGDEGDEDDNQEKEMEHLRKLGFQESGPVYNGKNCTEVSIFTIEIPKLLKALVE